MNKIPFKSKLQRFTNISNRNKAFDNLSKVEQRKEIAYEALKLTMGKEVKASSIDGYWSYSLRRIHADTAERFQEILIDKLPKCRVCERGLMMLAQIRLSNCVEPYDPVRVKGTKRNIKGFTIKSFLNMEEEYELCLFGHPYEQTSQGKLANIACNVIANGDFKTRDKTDYLTLWNI